jgi:hypothetical protein
MEAVFALIVIATSTLAAALLRARVDVARLYNGRRGASKGRRF